ncbi:MAG TPA: hypothetical protein PLN30_00440 [Ferruginibacter sp.]|nr:hypothetical protein [Ferruginibacter sp.]
MASDGLTHRAKKGTCRICQRSRNTDEQVKAVGEVRHGFATGHIWECRDIEDCDKVAAEKLSRNISGVIKSKIETALKRGRFTEYTVVV